MNRTYLTHATVSVTILCGTLLCAAAPFPKGTSSEKPVAQSLDFVVFGRCNFAVAAQQSGIAGIDLKTRDVRWKALSDKIVDVGPVVANDSVAVITNSFGTIYAFSKASGKLLWRKEHHSNVLVSDGQYFYVARPDDDGVSALDSRTGATVWTLQIPKRGGAAFLRIHDGSLYSNSFVVDLRSRKLIYEWPEDTAVTAIAFPSSGEVLLGDSEGNLTLYDSAFKLINRLHPGDTRVDAIAGNEAGILVSLAAPDSGHQGHIESLKWDGERRWDIPGLPINDMGFNPFAIVGGDALIVVPGKSEKEWRFESRNLATGKVNWSAPEGNYFMGWPAVCGNMAFLRDGDHIRGFNVSDGAPYGSEAAKPVVYEIPQP